MHPTESTETFDENVLEALREKIVRFLENTEGIEMANATLRIADVAINHHIVSDEYSRALRDELCSRFSDRLYYITVTDYTGRNGRRFADVKIEMKRGLLI